MRTGRTRFAPSPTGRLHLGHAYSAWCVRDFADRHGAEAYLRIEDTDAGRCRPEFEALILEDLAWLGLHWDGPIRRQSEHTDTYLSVLSWFRARGLLYRCFRSRADVNAWRERNGDASFTGSALSEDEEADRLAAGHPYAWRLSLARARETLGAVFEALAFTVEREGVRETVKAAPHLHGDIVLRRRDGSIAYHLAATHDDALQDMSHIVRGDDLADAPHTQVLLQALAGWPAPIYVHHTVIKDQQGNKLSKRHASQSLGELRKSGHTPADIWQMVGVRR